MNRVRHMLRRHWQTAAGVAFLSALPMLPLRADVQPTCGPKGCDCGGTYCQDSGGSIYMRWCSDGQGHCGCTINVSCG